MQELEPTPLPLIMKEEKINVREFMMLESKHEEALVTNKFSLLKIREPLKEIP